MVGGFRLNLRGFCAGGLSNCARSQGKAVVECGDLL